MMADSWFAVYLFLFLFSYSSEDATDCPGEISFIFSFLILLSFLGNRVHRANIYKAENFVASVGSFFVTGFAQLPLTRTKVRSSVKSENHFIQSSVNRTKIESTP